ncbi:MAG: hypothetical protein GY844_25265 [Bradyrhizobium sp.]|nr:hypothetical protein [Bradyrhizobium sp.]
MTSAGLALSTVLAATVAAGCFAYLLKPSLRVEADRRALPHAPNMVMRDKPASANIDRSGNQEKAIEAFQHAADAILNKAPNLRASAANIERPAAEKVPLPKKRPIARP